MLMTQRQMDLERIIGLKEESLEEMRHRYAQLELASTNHFREALKREAECERVSGQVTELARGIDLKDQKINELHRRIEELLKTSAASNALADKRSQELETLRRELGEARVESAGLRAVSK
jgi:chromosome segregation ATPase